MGIVSWFDVDVRVGGGSSSSVGGGVFVECPLAEGSGRKGFKGGFGSANGCWASDEKVLCGVLWRGDGRGGVFDPF